MLRSFAMLCLLVAPALADDDLGELNPEELTLKSYVQRAAEGKADIVTCMQGYFATKSGKHDWANTIFETCTEQGYVASMHWRSYMAHNGLGRPEDAAEAAMWDRRAAETGDPIGQFNYGLDLLRGHGVARDPIRGRQWVDRAAAQGLDTAQELQSSGYDPESVTPDADRWKYDADGKVF
ncbi:MAG: sel1 repeat family protein [Pseudomonadota bacterium]